MVTAEPALTPGERLPLSRERVLRTAVAIADEHGIEAVTMRRVGDELGAEAMSLYHHVANKNDLLDGVVDLVARGDQRRRRRSGHVGAVAARRPRADPGRPPGAAPAPLGAAGCWPPARRSARTWCATTTGSSGLLHDGGFSYDLAHHALHALGSRALGFSQELFDPGAGASAGPLPAELAAAVPSLVAMLSEVAHDDPDSTLGWCDDQTEFEFGLDLLLDGLERRRTGS